jgi:hypothetical protein
MPWDQLQAYGRSFNVGVFSYPMVWSTSGVGVNNKLWLFPAPSSANEMEWDATFLPAPLNTNDDYEAIPDPFTNAVQFWAARLAKIAALRYGEAGELEREYWKALSGGNSACDRSQIPNYYDDLMF